MTINKSPSAVATDLSAVDKQRCRSGSALRCQPHAPGLSIEFLRHLRARTITVASGKTSVGASSQLHLAAMPARFNVVEKSANGLPVPDISELGRVAAIVGVAGLIAVRTAQPTIAAGSPFRATTIPRSRTLIIKRLHARSFRDPRAPGRIARRTRNIGEKHH